MLPFSLPLPLGSAVICELCNWDEIEICPFDPTTCDLALSSICVRHFELQVIAEECKTVCIIGWIKGLSYREDCTADCSNAIVSECNNDLLTFPAECHQTGTNIHCGKLEWRQNCNDMHRMSSLTASVHQFCNNCNY